MAWSMPPPKKMKPSASRAARLNAARRIHRARSGSARVGLGTRAARSIRSKRPAKSTTGSVNSRRSSSICSSSRAPRVRKSCPRASYSTWLQPTPTPSAEPAAGQEIDIGCLPCHQRGLALREDQDPGGEPDPFGDAGQIGEHDERVVERVVLGVRAGQRRCAIGVHSAEHVVIGEEVVKAEVLDRSSRSAAPRRGSRRARSAGRRRRSAWQFGPVSGR